MPHIVTVNFGVTYSLASFNYSPSMSFNSVSHPYSVLSIYRGFMYNGYYYFGGYGKRTISDTVFYGIMMTTNPLF